MKRILPFLIILTVMLFAAHYAGYLLIINALPFLAIPNVFIRVLVILFFAASFVLTSVWTHNADTHRAKSFYRITAYWMGFFFYLFLAAALWSFLMIFFTASAVGLARLLLSAAFVLTVYGIRKAEEIVTKKYDVTLANMPQAWKSKQVIMLSDLHLGAVHGKEYAERVVREVQKLAPSIVFIVGDFFDGVKLNEADAASPFKNLKAADGIYFVTGNHDEFEDSTQKLAAIRAAGITILNNEKTEIGGVQIVGVDYLTTRIDIDFAQVLERVGIESGKPSILLKHVPSHMKTSAKAGISLVLSGHTHNGQQVPANYIASWTHKGFGYGLFKYRAMQAIVSSGVGTWGPPLRVGTQSEIVVINFK